MLEDLLAMAGHELRSPIAALRLQVSTLRRHPEAASDPLRLERLARQVERLSNLVENLLDVTRIAAGRMEVDAEEVELVDLVRDVLERLGPEISLSRTEVQVHHQGPVVGHWDRLRVQHIVTNLLSNALKYGDGKRIDVFVESVGDRVRLTVQDHGAGIDPDELERVFGRFTRLATERRIPGMGLGLWIVRNLTVAMGGTVSVESAHGRGSSFTIDLPVRPKTS